MPIVNFTTTPNLNWIAAFVVKPPLQADQVLSFNLMTGKADCELPSGTDCICHFAALGPDGTEVTLEITQAVGGVDMPLADKRKRKVVGGGVVRFIVDFRVL